MSTYSDGLMNHVDAARVIEATRAKGDCAIHVRHEGTKPDALAFKPGTASVQIIPAVTLAGGEPLVVKKHLNSCRGTELKYRLDASGVKELVVDELDGADVFNRCKQMSTDDRFRLLAAVQHWFLVTAGGQQRI